MKHLAATATATAPKRGRKQISRVQSRAGKARTSQIVELGIDEVKDTRHFWQGFEAEEIIQRSVAGDNIADVGETLDVLIDPDTARKWLSRNRHNRKISSVVVDRYSTDMSNGRWPYTHQGIAFDNQGHLLDGQHRLLACLQANATFPSQVTINLPESAGRAIDQGKSRSIADVATLVTGQSVESAAIAVCIRMMGSVDTRTPTVTRTESVEFYQKHKENVLAALQMLPRKTPGARAGVRAVIARALYTIDRLRLERFCEILCTGRYSPGEESALALREYLLKVVAISTQIHLEMYRRTEFALDAFLSNKVISRVRPALSERFKLPEEVTE